MRSRNPVKGLRLLSFTLRIHLKKCVQGLVTVGICPLGYLQEFLLLIPKSQLKTADQALKEEV